MGRKEQSDRYTAPHLCQALNNLENHPPDLPLIRVHGMGIINTDLVNGIFRALIAVDRGLVEKQKPSLLALADLQEGPMRGPETGKKSSDARKLTTRFKAIERRRAELVK